MKKKKLNSKLNLNRFTISNLEQAKGGMPWLFGTGIDLVSIVRNACVTHTYAGKERPKNDNVN